MRVRAPPAVPTHRPARWGKPRSWDGPGSGLTKVSYADSFGIEIRFRVGRVAAQTSPEHADEYDTRGYVSSP